MRLIRGLFIGFALSLALAVNAFAAADLDFTDKPFYVISILTSGTKTILLPNEDVTVVHLGLQDDGSTASVSTDKLILMHGADAMAANTNDGEKAIVFQSGSITFRGRDSRGSTTGDRVLQLRATGNGAKILIIKGNLNR